MSNGIKNYLLTTGFSFSLLTDFFILDSAATGIGLAIGTYPISILLRGIGWILLASKLSIKMFSFTWIIVLFLGFVVFFSFVTFNEIFLIY
jgi:hypothetical protein